MRNLAKALHALAVWLTVLVVALYALAMFLARGYRRRTLMWVGYEPRVRRRADARRAQDRPGRARLGGHQRRLDRTGRERLLLGRDLTAGAGRERLDHHRHPADPRRAARRARRAGRSRAGAFWRRISASAPSSPTGSPRACSRSCSSGARSPRPATHGRCCCSPCSRSSARMCCAARSPRSSPTRSPSRCAAR